MIVDEVKITVTGGAGGDGAVSFRREKFVPRGGPDGGNGGHGGNVFFLGVSDLMALNHFRSKKHIKGENGVKGFGKKRDGANADHLYVRIPIGTTIKDLKSQKEDQISYVGQKLLIARGGVGGRGNFEFRSAQNRTPKFAEDGTPGQTKELFLNLQFIADIGFIGLPNAGKSSLLNLLTAADVKTADYPFTTLEPNLGKFKNKIIADIPGLIEGASKGRGLGIKFLKHIEKTKLLVHCIDSTSQDILKDYKTVRNELKEYDPQLLSKPEIILLTKSDLLNKDQISEKTEKIKNLGKKVYPISVLDDESIDTFIQILKA